MSNPTPRPALNKAEDASIHPATSRPNHADAKPADPSGSTPAAERPQQPTKPRNARAASTRKPAAPARKFGGSTSDHLRVPDQPADPSAEAEVPATPTPTPTPTPKKKPAAPTQATKASQTRAAKPPVDLMGGKMTTLEVVVPKRLRKAAKAEAKARGLDVDAVVSELLHAWLTGTR
ncbi:unannotated protein [freshwater metagenome]|uniref:Unannotated protein n=1 Tax=freshwater metagenome TaxID=449393 RepID=A0A6J7I7R5_9ZZZZ|nr:hypothetical protein [Actinomycetota bacterium]MSW35784.1 hypothetical protein [Actinomycetota bacterium]